MLILRVTQKLYKEGTDWKVASKEEARHLIASIDLEDDQLPVMEVEPGEFIFTRDFLITFYIVDSYSDPHSADSEIDFAKLEALKEFAMYDAQELRYWFHDIPVGNHVLELSWTTPDSDGDQYLQFENTYLVGGGDHD